MSTFFENDQAETGIFAFSLISPAECVPRDAQPCVFTNGVITEITDSGCGIPPEIKDHIL